MSLSAPKRRALIAGAVALSLALAGVTAWALSTWGEVNRVTIDRHDDPSGAATQQEEPTDEGSVEVAAPADDGRRVFLLVGSDSREDLESTEGFGDFEGNRADVVMVLMKEGDRTGLLSLPRDLLVDDPCSKGDSRLSAMLEGCSRYNGASMLTRAVEDLIGVDIDHFAMVDLAGFQEAVDAVGGYEICVDNPVRDRRANLELPAGCTHADGEQTLAWLRSRHTQELTDDGWRTMPGMNDLVRNERQRAFLIDMMGLVADVTSPQAMAATAQSVAPFVTVDDDLSLVSAVNLALTMRGLDTGSVAELEIPVHDATTDDGASVLVPSEPVEEIVAEFLSATAADAGVVLDLAG